MFTGSCDLYVEAHRRLLADYRWDAPLKAVNRPNPDLRPEAERW